ncbi:NAD-dependent epimerase [Planococcus shixiaomingii]|uniref:NAD-dependent epimerase n=1 Tax=Planococcus shixiaomingii TaxID=3058393 RepID=UPI002627613B|nr:NAD-dependent epimerase [Planococcus sp. N022]WKA53869.1 NAD-dependent epimerase [Planococcus sp. N022]
MILVTGSSGFIGFHVAKRLLSEDFSVIGIDNMNAYYDVTLKEARLQELQKHPKFNFIQGDIEDMEVLSHIFMNNEVDLVIHLAAQAGVRNSLENPHIYIKTNVQGFLNILETSSLYKVKHLIYASSSSVYGANTKVPFSVHDSVDHPLSVYAATKKANELLAHTYSSLYKLPTTGLRFFTVYGPWGRPDMALFTFTKQILEGEPIKLYNYGKMIRGYTFIDDVVEAIVSFLDKPAEPDSSWSGISPDPAASYAPYRLYNIGGNEFVNLEEYISLLEEKLGKKANKQLYPMQPGDVPVSYADSDDLFQVTGIKAMTPISDGIKKFVDWYIDFYKI